MQQIKYLVDHYNCTLLLIVFCYDPPDLYTIIVQEVKYVFLKMESVKGLLSRIYLAGVITQLPQCILFLIRVTVLSNLTLDLILKPFHKTLVIARSQNQWFKFHIMALMAVLKMVCPTKRNSNNHQIYNWG